MNKVAWYSGLAISQHHFQTQDSYYEFYESLRSEFSDLNYYGLKQLEVEEAPLAQGIIKINKCAALFPDGTMVKLPAEHVDSLSISVDSNDSEKILYLAIPGLSTQGKCVTSVESEYSNVRYRIQQQSVHDAMHGVRQSEAIDVLVPNFRLVIGQTVAQNCVLLPLLRIKSVTDSGGAVIDKEYIVTKQK